MNFTPRLATPNSTHTHATRRTFTTNLQGTKVTAAAVEKLAKALPKCKIDWNGGTVEPKL